MYGKHIWTLAVFDTMLFCATDMNETSNSQTLFPGRFSNERKIKIYTEVGSETIISSYIIHTYSIHTRFDLSALRKERICSVQRALNCARLDYYANLMITVK